MDFSELKEQGKTVIYAETETKDKPRYDYDWEYWSKRRVEDQELYVWRAIVTFEEADQYKTDKLFN